MIFLPLPWGYIPLVSTIHARDAADQGSAEARGQDQMCGINMHRPIVLPYTTLDHDISPIPPPNYPNSLPLFPY